MTAYETLQSLPFASGTPTVRHVRVHPSGRLLVLVSDAVMLAEYARGVPRPLPGRAHDAAAVAMSPDGRRLAIATRHRGLVIRDPGPGPAHREIELSAIPVAVEWVDDGNVLVVTAHGGIALFDVTSGALSATLFGPRSDGAFGGLAVVRRSRILVHAWGSQLRSVEIDTGRLLWERALEGEPRWPNVSNDGSRIVITGPVGTEGGPWRRLTPTGRLKRPGMETRPSSPEVLRRGLRVLHTADGSDVAAGPPFAYLGIKVAGDEQTFEPRPKFSPDAARIAVNLPNGALAIYDVATMRPEQVVPRSEVIAWIEDLSFSPEGDEVVFGTRHDHIGRFSISGAGLTSSIEGLDPELLGSEAPTPWVAGVASLLVPGLGQLLNGQIGKAVACLVASILTLSLCGILNAVWAVDASRIARRIGDGEEVGPWQSF